MCEREIHGTPIHRSEIHVLTFLGYVIYDLLLKNAIKYFFSSKNFLHKDNANYVSFMFLI